MARKGRQIDVVKSNRIGSMQVYNTLNRYRQVSWQCLVLSDTSMVAKSIDVAREVINVGVVIKY